MNASTAADPVGLGARTARGAAILAARQAFGLVASAVASIALARLLHAHDFGEFAVINAVVFLPASLFGDFGIGITLVRPFEEPSVQEWTAAGDLTTRAVQVCATLVALAAAGATALGYARIAMLIVLCGLGLTARLSRSLPSARLQRRGEFGQIAIAETIENIGYVTVVVALAAAGTGALALAGAVAVKECAAALWLQLRAPQRQRQQEPQAVRKLLRLGIPPQLGGALIALTDLFQPIAIGALLGVSSLGYVSWAYSTALTPMLLVSALDRVLLPALSKIQHDPQRSALWVERAIRLNCAAVVPMVVVLAAARRDLVLVLFGRQWLPAAGFFVAFAPAIVATALSAPILHAFNAVGKTKVGMYLSIRWFALTWTIGLAATAIGGRVGFGWFYAVVQLGYAPLWWKASRELGVRVLRTSAPFVAGAVVAVGAATGFDSLVSRPPGMQSLAAHVGIALTALVGVVALWNRDVLHDIQVVLSSVSNRTAQAQARYGAADQPPANAGAIAGAIAGANAGPIAGPIAGPFAGPFAGDDRRLGYHKALDGLRAFAVVAVLIYHLHLPHTGGGFLGVDIFFALSGFLITSLLIEEQLIHGAVSLRKFYARRAYRLAPALLGLLVFALVVARFGDAKLTESTWFGLPFALTYTTNWAATITGRSLGLFQHTWSLAIEEQFYMLWPPLLVWWMLRKQSARTIMTKLGVAIGAGATWTAWLWHQNPSIDRVYYPLDTRASELLIGAFGAVAWMYSSKRLPRFCKWIAPAGLGCVAVAMAFAVTGDGWLYPYGLTLVAVLSTAAVIAIVAFPDTRFNRLLSAAPLRHLGKISYGLYVWHFPVYELAQLRGVKLPVRYLVPMELAGSYLLAVASYRWIEQPFLRRKARLAASQPAIGEGESAAVPALDITRAA